MPPGIRKNGRCFFKFPRDIHFPAIVYDFSKIHEAFFWPGKELSSEGIGRIILREEEANKSVSKNVTLPSWLNQLAMESKINFSNTLQEALREKLGV